ncbi:MAG: glycerol-3-phosphate 1-O-acyltransferase PlsY [Ignavibacteria bacterium]|nr:glycerol-3-phosphate 1-O-acyltransferase PlsY [Ignavibacteria bacterium]
MIYLLIIIALSYLVGSFPTALIFGKLFKGIDIRLHGSKNLGSTNAFRVLGWKLGVLVQLVDISKGFIATLLISKLFYGSLPFENRTPFQDITIVQIIAGISAIIGHVWTVFAGFKGGKGINTAAGMLLSLAPVDATISIGIFIVVLIFSGYVSLGSISAAFAFPSTMFIRENFFKVDIDGYHTLIYFSIAVCIFLIYNHRANIKRLMYGEENRFEKWWKIRWIQIDAPFKRKKKVDL